MGPPPAVVNPPPFSFFWVDPAHAVMAVAVTPFGRTRAEGLLSPPTPLCRGSSGEARQGLAYRSIVDDRPAPRE